jgi:hypothetical protein
MLAVQVLSKQTEEYSTLPLPSIVPFHAAVVGMYTTGGTQIMTWQHAVQYFLAMGVI